MKKIFFTLSLLIVHTAIAKDIPNIHSIKTLQPSKNQEVKTLIKQYPDLARYLKKSVSEELKTLLNYIATSDKLVIVKFYADWCGPCRKMMHIVKRIAQKFSDSVEFIEINIDYHTAVEKTFGVRYIPTFIMFKNGKEIERLHSLPESRLVAKIENILKK